MRSTPPTIAATAARGCARAAPATPAPTPGTAWSLCGFAFTHSLVRDIFVGFVQMREPAREARIPTTLPVLIQGELDPVGENLAGTRRLVERYRALGLTRIETRYYAGARHELLSETNRDEVTGDVLGWVAKTV